MQSPLFFGLFGKMNALLPYFCPVFLPTKIRNMRKPGEIASSAARKTKQKCQLKELLKEVHSCRVCGVNKPRPFSIREIEAIKSSIHSQRTGHSSKVAGQVEAHHQVLQLPIQNIDKQLTQVHYLVSKTLQQSQGYTHHTEHNTSSMQVYTQCCSEKQIK